MAGALSSGYDSAPDVDGRHAFLGIAGSSAATCSLCPVSSKMSCDRRNSTSLPRVTFSERTLTGLSLSLSLSLSVCVCGAMRSEAVNAEGAAQGSVEDRPVVLLANYVTQWA